jgi:hypothetical protein
MIAQLMQAKGTSATPPPKIPAPLNEVNAGLEEEDANKNKEARSSTKGEGKVNILIGIPPTR